MTSSPRRDSLSAEDNTERDADIFESFLSGEPQVSIAERYGISKQRVDQILRGIADKRDVVREHGLRRKLSRRLAEAIDRASFTKRCVLCGGMAWRNRSESGATCSRECATIWMGSGIRRVLSPESYLRSRAAVLRGAATRDDHWGVSARGILESGAAPNRFWTNRGSYVDLLIRIFPGIAERVAATRRALVHAEPPAKQ